MPPFKDLAGQTFGRLTALKRAAPPKRIVYWRCRCVCGRMIVVLAHALTNGNTQSCGCLKSEIITNRSTRHGMCGTREYIAWMAAKARCFNPKNMHYADYGGRGITMCAEWRADFATFFRAVGRKPTPAHSLDRIDNERGYEPGNVRWATRTQQANNTRANRIAVHNGDRKTVAEVERAVGSMTRFIEGRLVRGWAEKAAIETPRQRPPVMLLFRGRMCRAVDLARQYGLNYQTLRKRLRTGMSAEAALTTPIDVRFSRHR